jgi:hypothetical protein
VWQAAAEFNLCHAAVDKQAVGTIRPIHMDFHFLHVGQALGLNNIGIIHADPPKFFNFWFVSSIGRYLTG